MGDGRLQQPISDVAFLIIDEMGWLFFSLSMYETRADTHTTHVSIRSTSEKKDMMQFIELIDNMRAVSGSFSYVLVDVFHHERNRKTAAFLSTPQATT